MSLSITNKHNVDINPKHEQGVELPRTNPASDGVVVLIAKNKVNKIKSFNKIVGSTACVNTEVFRGFCQ